MVQVDFLVEFTKSGGLMGLWENLVITKDGRATADTRSGLRKQREYFKITQKRLTDLHHHLEAADFANLPRKKVKQIPDGVYYQITYDGTWFEMGDLPDRLRPAFERLTKILRAHGGKL